MAQRVITRFAPSPTGLLHGGNYRTAIFAYLFAKKTGGEFIVRIEDTDTARSKKEYEDNILETLRWLGLTEDRLFRQHENVAKHSAELKRLIDQGDAYISNETPKEEGERSSVIRFKNPGGTVSFVDSIRGTITTDVTDLGDFVIARSITEPVFHFAVVVDDADVGVTHVVRGEDHISNTPRQILIQRALGYETPVYAHLPLVLGPDRTKLSKRRGAKALTQYRDEGFLPEAVINYLALLGWHPEDEQELFSIHELTLLFSLDRIQKGAGIFDEVKLRWFNHEHIKRLPPAVFVERLRTYASKQGTQLPVYLEKIASILQERVYTLKEAAQAALSDEFDFLDSRPTPDAELLVRGAKTDGETARMHLTHVVSLLEQIPDTSFSAETTKEVVFPYATKQGRGAVLWPMRVALSGKEKSPDPFTLCALLGKQESLERLIQAAKRVLK